MKRNYPPGDEDPAELRNAEHEIITKRLEELFGNSRIRNTPLANKATYLEHAHHTRLESVTCQPDGLTYYDRENKYHYLDSYQALYMLESRQISIYYNELPLSIAEAYNLLVRDPSELKKYVVFAHLNRVGFFCRAHQYGPLNLVATPAFDELETRDVGENSPSTSSVIKPTKPLLCDIKPGDSELHGHNLSRLRRFGPQDSRCSPPSEAQDLEALISFDAYKRETYKLNKPKADSAGRPDYYVIIQDKNSVPTLPSDHMLSSSNETVLDKCLFAIVDGDNSISFVLCGALMFPSDMRD